MRLPASEEGLQEVGAAAMAALVAGTAVLGAAAARGIVGFG